MTTRFARLWLLASPLFASSCSSPAPASADVSASPSAVTAACATSYSVTGDIRNAVGSVSIDGTAFTDTRPFQCIVARGAAVTFNFNGSSTDPQSNCPYSLNFSSDSDPSFSSQTLSCSKSQLEFRMVGTPEAGNDNCRGLGPVSEDPKIILVTEHCGS